MSSGLAIGQAHVYTDVLQRNGDDYQIEPGQVSEEQKKLTSAIDDVRRSLHIDAKEIEGRLCKKSADIFIAHESMLLDSSVREELKKTVETEEVTAERAVRKVFGNLAGRFRKMNDEVLRERGDDVEDLSRRMLRSLTGIHAHCLENLPAQSVLVARRLLPSDTVFLSRLSTVAVLAEFAGPSAHAALLARELGIPCVGGISNLLESVHEGDVVLVNGNEGTAVINPESRALREYEEAVAELRIRRETLQRESLSKPTVTLDGVEVAVMANVRAREDVEVAMKGGADGIGLFRTEPFFMSCKHFPTNTEFAGFLMESLQLALGKHVDVRLLDVGADKKPPYFHLPQEPDPFLGRRGVRLLLKYPDLLEAQLRAVLEVSRRISIGILIPMVTTESDVAQVAERLRKLADEMGISKLPRLGAMIETPAAALAIQTLKDHVDFFSIGSNDLTQYTMAAGRENPMVAEYFMDDHPAVLRLIEMVVREAGDTPVCLCGELAGRIEAMPRLLATGIRSLSVAAALVPEVKNSIRRQNLGGGEPAVQAAPA